MWQQDYWKKSGGVMTLELTKEEFNTLRDVVENDISGLKMEVLHTDSRQYRDLLKKKEQILEKILAHPEFSQSEPEKGERELAENQILGR